MIVVYAFSAFLNTEPIETVMDDQTPRFRSSCVAPDHDMGARGPVFSPVKTGVGPTDAGPWAYHSRFGLPEQFASGGMGVDRGGRGLVCGRANPERSPGCSTITAR